MTMQRSKFLKILGAMGLTPLLPGRLEGYPAPLPEDVSHLELPWEDPPLPMRRKVVPTDRVRVFLGGMEFHLRNLSFTSPPLTTVDLGREGILSEAPVPRTGFELELDLGSVGLLALPQLDRWVRENVLLDMRVVYPHQSWTTYSTRVRIKSLSGSRLPDETAMEVYMVLDVVEPLTVRMYS